MTRHDGAEGEETGAAPLGHLTTRTLLAERARARRAVRRGRSPDRAAEMLDRIEAELHRRAAGRWDRAGREVPPDLRRPEGGEG